MTRLDPTVSHGKRRDDEARAEMFECRSTANDVDDRIDRSDLVKVHILDARPMNLSLRLGQPQEGFVRPRTNARGQIGRVQHGANRTVRAFGLLAIDVYLERPCHDAASRAHAKMDVVV